MDKETYYSLKKQKAEISEKLEGSHLTPEEREKLEIRAEKISGALCRTWLPVPTSHRIGMLLLFVGGLYGFIVDDPFFAILWVVVPLLSPRLMGEVTYLLGRFTVGPPEE